MKTLKRMIFVLAGILALNLNAAFLPEVGNGTALNVWTRNISDVLNAAKVSGDPIFCVMVNEESDGTGCSRCMDFVSKTLKVQGFADIVQKYDFYMVFLNRMSIPAYGYVSNFDDWYWKWGSGKSYPFVGIIGPDGICKYRWDYPRTGGTKIYEEIERELRKYCALKTEFSLASGTSTTLNPGEEWKGQVVRSGETGLSGNLMISLSGANAAKYTVEPSIINWDASDGMRNVTVKSKDANTETVIDELILKIEADSGFLGTKRSVQYGTQEIKLTFRDQRVAKSLSEFATVYSGKLAFSSDSAWFQPTNATCIATITSSATLEIAAKSAGVLELDLQSAAFKMSLNGKAAVTVEGKTTIGCSVNDKIVLTAPAGASKDSPKGFGIKFTSLSAQLVTPQTGVSLAVQKLRNDKTLQFSWSNTPVPNGMKMTVSYEVYGSRSGEAAVFASQPFYSGSNRNVDGFAAGFLTEDVATGKCWWGVKVTYSGADYGKAVVTKTGSFNITGMPEFSADMPDTVSVYYKNGTLLDFSANKIEGVVNSYSAEGLPSGMEIDAATGIVSGAPKKKGTYSVTITVSNEHGSVSKTVEIVASKFPSDLKGKFNGILFDANGVMKGSVSWSVSTSGKWKGTIVHGGGKIKLSGVVVFDEKGKMWLDSSEMPLWEIDGTSIWTGVWNGLVLYAQKTVKPGSEWSGNWTCGAVAYPGYSGYAKVKVSSSGKVSFSGKVACKHKIGGSGQMLVLDPAVLSVGFPAWINRGQRVALMYSWKKSSGRVFDGGFAFFGDGALSGKFDFNGARFESEGSRWSKPSFESLNAAAFVADGLVSFNVAVKTQSKIQAEQTESVKAMKAKLSATKSSGVFKGSFKVDGATAKYEGILYFDGGILVGIGGGCLSGGDFFTVGIGQK